MVLNLLLLSFIIGIAAGSALPVLPSLPAPGLLLVFFLVFSLFLLLLYRYGASRYPRYRPVLLCSILYAAVSLAGFSWAVFYGQGLWAERLPDRYAGEDFLVEGRVIHLPEQTERGERFDFEIEQILQTPAPIADTLALKKLRLNSYDITPDNEFLFQPGQRWRLWVRLKPPRGMVNPGGFDYEGWLLQEGYSAVGYVRASPGNTLLLNKTMSIGNIFDQWGFASLQWINAHIGSLDQRALFAAIALGYKEEFTRHHWELLKNTGTIHLVVVSGLNIVLAASVGYFLLSGLSRVLFFPLYLFPAPVWGAMGAIVLAVFYAGMTGLSLPTQRSLVMVLCGLMTVLLRQQIRVSSGFLFALAVVLILDPLACFTASLWLSFGAVAILLYCFSSRIILQGKKYDFFLFMKQWLQTQCFVSLGIFPFLAYWMGSVALVSPLANLFAVPYATFVLLPLTIFSGLSFALSPAIGHFVLVITGGCMDVFWWFLQYMQQLNVNWYMTTGNVEHFDTPSQLSLLLSVFAVMILLSPRGIVSRYYGVVLLLPLLLPLHHRLPENEFEMTLVDVGQGLSLVIETGHHLMVYDVGNRYSDQFDIGRDVVAQLIRRKGFDHVDTLVISHSDSDHAGGLQGLLGELAAYRILSGNADIIQQRVDVDNTNGKIKIEPCVKGQHWQFDGVSFDVLSPAVAAASTGKRNSYSCVIRVGNAHFSMLLTGDIEADLENILLDSGNLLKATVLVVPHHGSKTSSSLAFLQNVDPALALISVGYKSQYGHPHPEVVKRYGDLHIPLLRSDLAGAISINSQRGIARTSRSEGMGYWRRW